MHKSLEVNLFNFNNEIYGDELVVYLHAHLRSDNRFSDLEELKAQLIQDRAKALEALKDIPLN
jgi:riboflavin kinase/FMN adenylyltransferase